jgi:hypothetical protein
LKKRTAEVLAALLTGAALLLMTRDRKRRLAARAEDEAENAPEGAETKGRGNDEGDSGDNPGGGDDNGTVDGDGGEAGG